MGGAAAGSSGSAWRSPVGSALRALFVLYLAATAVHLTWVAAHEPFSFDAWNFALATGAKPVTVGRFFEFWIGQYFGSNPRFGQPFAYLSYKLEGFFEVGTPLVYLALVLGAFVLGTGRWPSWRRGKDLAALALATGILWFAAPSLPMVMFCRAYSTNYVWACAIQLWFLVPMRLALAGSTDAAAPAAASAQPSTARLAAYAFFGVLAGMCNEHIGPALLLLLACLTLWSWRQQGRAPRLLVAGSIGALVGFALIFFAPGQGQRYDGLAEQATLGERLLQRGFTRNLDILQQYLDGAAPLLVFISLAVIVGLLSSPEATAARRAALRTLGLAIAFGLLVTITIFVSPKLGPRFYLHSCIGLLAAFLGLVDSFLDNPWGKRLLAALLVVGVITSGYAAYQTVPLFGQLHRESAERLRRLQAQPRGAVVTVESFSQVPMSWWFLGDDFRDRNKRDLVAKYFDLGRVILRGSDAEATLGVTDVRLRFRARTEPATCLGELPGAALPELKGRDVATLQHAFADTVTRLRAAATAQQGQLRRLDLEVEFEGQQPPMVQPHLYVASWRDGELLAYAATVLRVGATRARQVTLPPKLRQEAWDIYAFAVGHGAAKLGTSRQAEPLRHTPERFKQYWILACRPGECFVLSARR